MSTTNSASTHLPRISYMSETQQYILAHKNKEIMITEEDVNTLLFPNEGYAVRSGRMFASDGTPLLTPTSFQDQITPFGDLQPIPDATDSTRFASAPTQLAERLNSAMTSTVFDSVRGLGLIETALLMRAMRGLNNEREMRQELKIQRQLNEAEAGKKNIEKSEEKLEAERGDAIAKFCVQIVAAGVAGGVGGTTGYVVSQAVSESYSMISKVAPPTGDSDGGFMYQADEAGIDMQEYQWVDKAHQQAAQEEGDQISAAREQFKALSDLIRLIADNIAQQAGKLFN